MPVYMILNVEVTDSGTYDEYKTKVPALVEKFGGRYLVRGDDVETTIGDWHPGRIVLLEFPSLEHIQNWLASPEYAPLAALREKSTKVKGLIVEGCSTRNELDRGSVQ